MQTPLERMLLFPEPKVVRQDNSSMLSIVSLRKKLMFTSSSSSPPSAHLLNSLERWCLRARAYGPGVTNIDITISGPPHGAAEEEGPDGALVGCGEYRIAIESPDFIRIQASSRHLLSPALATLAQLLALRPVRLHLPLLLHDWPHYAWRGLLVDVSRHFLPLPLLRRCIDAMEASRLNVLHLHLTDAASFPLLLNDTALADGTPLPLSLLALRGAFHNETKIYTAEGLRGLVDYAAQRGIVIVPEIDLPAHSFSWGKAFPQLVLPHNASTSKVKSRDMVPLDVSQPQLLPVVRAVLAQVSEIFPSRFLHVGGDEVRPEPWAETPRVVAWLAQQEPKRSVGELFRSFESSVFDMLASFKKRPLVWQGVQDAKAMPVEGTATVQPWKCWGGLALRAAETAMSSGHPVVMSSCWYLDADSDWLTFLAADQGAEAVGRMASPRTGNVRGNISAATVPAPNASLLLGGEASMWTEKVDCTNFECRVWPRAAAIAARLWGLPPHQGASAALLELTRLKVTAGLRGRTPLRKHVDIEPAEATLLHAGFVHAREVLLSLGVQAAPFSFHHLAANSTPSAGETSSAGSSNPSSQQQPMVVTTAASEDEALALLRRFAVSHTLTADQQQQPAVQVGGARMTAQCLSLPQEVQRPVVQRAVRLLQLNVADGSGQRLGHLTRWLLDKATQGVVLAGLCELNGWDKMHSGTDFPNNLELMAVRAANAGFIHSHVLASREHPYNLGVISALPFVVLHEVGPPALQRGLLHVYVAALRLHVVVLHLHAHDAARREDECRLVAGLLAPLLKQGARVVVQGDLNTLSEWDAAKHEASGLVGQLQRTDHEGYARLAKKFLSGGGPAYRPMGLLLEAGLSDACVESCLPGRGSKPEGGPRWRSGADDAFSRCMSARCRHSMPSNFSGEWPLGGASAPHPPVRVDFVLLSAALLRDADKGVVHAGIDGSALASGLSDHLAMEVEWDEAQPFELFR